MDRKISAYLIVSLLLSLFQAAGFADERPNILWITSEDNGPQLGCYGDEFATSPNIDSIAARGTTYLHAWSNAPVCAPARTAIITGMYPNSIGAHHMRSMVPLPVGVKMFPQFLKEAGYYCSNNKKEDYNVEKPEGVWDESSRNAHWRNRKDGQPFFSVFNITVSHESQIRKRPHAPVHDPAKVRVPAYHPDHPEVRLDWAQYYDKVTEMDKQVGDVLTELDEDGLTNSTIVFYFGDHGPGMPRNKRWPNNQGLHVPMVVHIPEKFKSLRSDDYDAGGKSKRLVSFVDLAPTVLSLTDLDLPDFLQGKAFLGPHTTEPPKYIYGFRDRMDERYDMVRSIRTERYELCLNLMPHRIYGQHLHYLRQTPTDRIWKELFDAGKLNAAQSFYWKTKPVFELYDLKNDPDEVNNLFESLDQKAYRNVIDELTDHLDEWLTRIKDVGYLPESELHRRLGNRSPFDMARKRGAFGYNFDAISIAANGASQWPHEIVKRWLSDRDSALRYWALQSIHIQGKDLYAGHPETAAVVIKLVDDESPCVAVSAAELVAMYETGEPKERAIKRLLELANLENNSVYVCFEALNVIDRLDEQFEPYVEQLKSLPRKHKKVHKRLDQHVTRLLDKTLSDIASTEDK